MDKTDRDTFILENMGLVRMVVNRYKNRIYGHSIIDIKDLENVGVIGLMKAYERFNPNYGTQFSTYAVPMIDGEIRRCLRDDIDPIRFPRQSKINCRKIIQANLLSEEPEIIAEKLEISIDDVQKALDYYNYRFVNSLEMEVYEDEGNAVLLGDVIGTEMDFDSNLEVGLFLNRLDERSRKIVELKLQGFTQKEIGKKIGVSQAQVSRNLISLQEKIKKGEIPLINDNADYVLAKQLAEETDLRPVDIQKKTGISYPTALKYVKEYREEEKSKEKVSSKRLDKRLDIPAKTDEEVDGFITMTFKLSLKDDTDHLSDIVKAMEQLGFKDLNITIQSQQGA